MVIADNKDAPAALTVIVMWHPFDFDNIGITVNRMMFSFL